MLNKKNTLFFLCSLFICFFVHTFSMQADNKQVENEVVSQHTAEITGEYLIKIEGVLQSLVKVNENNHLPVQGFKNGKKSFSLILSYQPTATLPAFNDSYSLLRMNRIRVSPFYIEYHRLII